MAKNAQPDLLTWLAKERKTKPWEVELPPEEIERRHQETTRVCAVADVYVMTNQIRQLLADRTQASRRALEYGATVGEIRQAFWGATGPPRGR